MSFRWVVYILCILLMAVCCTSARGQDYGTPADMCDLDDFDCTLLADTNVPMYNSGTTTWLPTDLEAYGDTFWSRVDGTNLPTTGVWQFGDDVQGPETGCSTITSAEISGSPISKDGTDYIYDVFGACSSGCEMSLGLLFDDTPGLEVFGFACCDTVPYDMSAGFVGGYWATGDDVYACLVDVTSLVGPTGYETFLSNESDCADVDTLIDNLAMAGDWVVAYTKAFDWNASTCEYDTVALPSGWSWYSTACGGSCGAGAFPASPAITTDSVMVYAWQITDAGAASVQSLTVATSMAVGEGSYAQSPPNVADANQAGVWVHKLYTDISPTLYHATTNYYRSGMSFMLEGWPDCEDDPLCQTLYGIRGVSITRGAGDASQIVGALVQTMSGGTGHVYYGVGFQNQVGAENASASMGSAIFYNTAPVTTGTVDSFVGLLVNDIGTAEAKAVGVDIVPLSAGPDVLYGVRTKSDVFFPSLAPTVLYEGTHTGVTGGLQDSNQVWDQYTQTGASEWVGQTIYNVTQDESGTISGINSTANSITSDIGTDFDTDDEYQVLSTSANNDSARLCFGGDTPSAWGDEAACLQYDGTDDLLDVTGKPVRATYVSTTEDVTCSDATDTCAYSSDVVTTRLTSGSDTTADVTTVTDGYDGQRRTFVFSVDNLDDVTIDVSTNGNGTDTTMTTAGQTVTYEYDGTTDTWEIVGKN